MTETTSTSVAGRDDKVVPILVYALHLLFFATALTPIAAVVLAYVSRDRVADWRHSHYEFAIRTFWLGLAASVGAGFMILAGIPLLLLFGLGVIPMVVGGLLFGVIGIWFAVRCIAGLVYVLNGQPYPRPYSLFI